MWGDMSRLRMVKKNKKGFEISFSWLFSIIAGMSIFLFLVWFAVQQTDLFGNLTAKVAVEELDIAFTGFKSNLVGSKLEFGKEIELEFKCDTSTLDEERMFVNGIAGKKLKGNIVFAPSLMESNEFRLFTAGWNVPFRVTNFIFLNSNKDLLNLNDMSEDFGDIPGIFNDGTNSVPFQIFQTTLSGSCPAEKTIYYQIDLDTGEAFGTICINGNPHPYYGTAFVYAAIFADSKNFVCIYDNAIEKFNVMKEIYLEKLKVVGGCSLEKGNIRDALEQLNLRNLDISRIKINEIEDNNNDLLRKGCEGLY